MFEIIIIFTGAIIFYMCKNNKFKNIKKIFEFVSTALNKQKIIEKWKKDIIADFTINPLSFKVQHRSINNFVIYAFDNGDVIIVYYYDYFIEKISKNKKIKIKVTPSIVKDYLSIFKHLLIKTKQKSYSYKKTTKQQTTYKKKTKFYSDEQLKYQEKYKKLFKIYKLRKEHYESLNDNNKTKEILKNELNVVIKKLKILKPKTGLF